MIIPLSWFNHLGKKKEEKYICYYRKGNPGFSQFASENAQTSSHKEKSHQNQEQGMI